MSIVKCEVCRRAVIQRLACYAQILSFIKTSDETDFKLPLITIEMEFLVEENAFDSGADFTWSTFINEIDKLTFLRFWVDFSQNRTIKRRYLWLEQNVSIAVG